MNRIADGPSFRKFKPGIFQSDEEVTSQFVVRQRELDLVLDVLRGNIHAPSCQHVLIVAPRGRGKTMLLARIAAELRTNTALSGGLLPVLFMEENREILDLDDFWLETLFYLAKESAAHDPALTRELRTTHTDLNARWKEPSIGEQARAAVLTAADRLQRQIVLMVENLQSLSDVNSDFGWQLREALQSDPQIILLASATSRFKGLDDAAQPFFELFRIIGLDPLDTDACRHLWHTISGDAVSERSIRPLEILTGGSPRLLVIVAAFAKHRSLHQLMEELVVLIDDHNEYFRSHLDTLPKTERRVYTALIDLWRPSKAGEIATRARQEIRAVSTMLGRLVKRGAVIVEGSASKRLYSPAERLYCIYYKLQRERDEATVVLELIRFMAAFYNEAELAEMSEQMVEAAWQSDAIRAGIEQARIELPDIAKLVRGGDALVGANAAPDIQMPAAQALFTKAVERAQRGDIAGAFETFDEMITRFGTSAVPGLQGPVALALLNRGILRCHLGDVRAAIEDFDTMLKRVGTSTTPNLQGLVSRALVNKGAARAQLGDVEGAIAAFDEVVERFRDSAAAEDREPIVRALLNRGSARTQLGDVRAAIGDFDEAIQRGDTGAAPDLQGLVSMALVNKGIGRTHLGDGQGAVAIFDEVIERFATTSPVADTKREVARALLNKGVARAQLGDVKGAIAAFDAVVERFGNGDGTDVHGPVADALFNKGVGLAQLGDVEGAIAAVDAVVERFGNSATPDVQEPLARALLIKGAGRAKLGDVEGAIGTFDKVIERFGSSAAPDVQGPLARALLFKGVASAKLGDVEGAFAAFDKVIERFGNSAAPDVQEPLARALLNKGVGRTQLGDVEGAIGTFDKVIERFGNSVAPDVQEPLARALLNKGVTSAKLGDAESAIAAFDEVAKRFGSGAAPELQGVLAAAFLNKGVARAQLGDVESAIKSFDEVITRFASDVAPDVQEAVARALLNKARSEWKTIYGRARTLLAKDQRREAMDAFRSAYAVFAPNDETMLPDMLRFVVELLAAGVLAEDLVTLLSRDEEKARTLRPLVVALRQYAGEDVREPTEVLEVAADILRTFPARPA